MEEAINAINATREEMNEAQFGLERARRKLAKAEAEAEAEGGVMRGCTGVWKGVVRGGWAREQITALERTWRRLANAEAEAEAEVESGERGCACKGLGVCVRVC